MEKSLVKDNLFFFYRDGENDSMSMCWLKLSSRKEKLIIQEREGKAKLLKKQESI